MGIGPALRIAGALTTALFIGGCGSVEPTPTAPTPPSPTPAPVVAPTPSPQPAPEPAPPPAPPTAPTISNISAHFSGQSCTRAADHLRGSALVVQFDFTDPNGDLPGGKVMLNRTYNTGRSEFHASPIPGDPILTGSPTAGHVEVDNECPLYDNNQSTVETLSLIDAAGLTSNSLSTTTQRPPGAP